jgi:hypothetical protein
MFSAIRALASYQLPTINSFGSGKSTTCAEFRRFGGSTRVTRVRIGVPPDHAFAAGPPQHPASTIIFSEAARSGPKRPTTTNGVIPKQHHNPEAAFFTTNLCGEKI